MKKIYSLVAAVSLTSLSFGQGYVISPSNTVNETIEVNNYYSNTIYLEHDGTDSSDLNMEWELIDVQVNGDWDYSVCDYTNCYTGNITTGTMVPYGPGINGFIKVTLLAPSTGSGHFIFTVNKVGDPNVDTLYFYYNAILGVTDLELGTEVQIYPNPSTNGDITITNVLEGSQVTITSALGNEVKSFKANGATAKTSLKINRGLYFVRLERNGEIYATRRLIVK